MTPQPLELRPSRLPARSAAVIACLAVIGVSSSACPKNVPPSGTAMTPVFRQAFVPDTQTGGWKSITTSSPFEVLPTAGRGLRIEFDAPADSAYRVTLVELDGTSTTLSQNTGTPAPPEAGYFQIVSEQKDVSPAVVTMYVRAPLTLGDLSNYDVNVVNIGGLANMADSAPMVVSFRAKKNFNVTVTVNGPGRVQSQPPGLLCGRGSLSGAALTPCSFDFGQAGAVELRPNSVDPATTRFQGWGGNCAPNVQVCTLTLDGSAPAVAVATFVPTSQPSPPVSNCPVPPLLPGMRWIDLPQCGPGATTSVALCDANGFFCCISGGSDAGIDTRCPGGHVAPANCMHRGTRASLRQPGGCYEVADVP